MSRAGKRVQPIDGRTRNPRVLLYRLRFACCFGKLGQHNNARRARTKAEGAAPKTYENRAKIDQKSVGNHRKTEPNRRKIVGKSILAGFGRPSPVQGRVGARSGRDLDAPKPAQEQSWDAPGSPRAAGRRPRASPGRLPLIMLPQGPGSDTYWFPSFFPSLFSFFFSLPFFIDFLSHFPLFFPSSF